MTSVVSICEWIFGGRPLDEIAGIARRAGYDAVELAGEPGRRDRAVVREQLGGLAVSGLSAMGRWPTDERDLAHPEPAARRRAVDYYSQLVKLADEVGAPTVGVNATASGRLDTLTDYRTEWSFVVEGLRELAYVAGEHAVVLAVEPLNRYETPLVNRVEQALALVDEVGMPGVGVAADAFHMQMEEADPIAAIRQAGSQLKAIHLADSNRRGLGQGTADVGPLLLAAREAGFSGPVVMEFLAPGPNPFEPNKGPEAMALLGAEAEESASQVRKILDA